jgi:hypothetical protein
VNQDLTQEREKQHERGRSGLQQQDFSVYLDKEPQPITNFRAVAASSAGAATVQIILLVDAVNTRYLDVADCHWDPRSTP